MRLRFKKAYSVSTIVILIIVGLFLYIKNTPFDTLIVKAISPQSFSKIESDFAKFVLFTFRGNETEINSLESKKGLNFIIAYPDDRSIEVLDWLIVKGADINTVSPIDDLPPLHAAILYDNITLAGHLINLGADSQVPNKKDGSNGCQFLEQLKTSQSDTAYKQWKILLGCE